MELVAVGIIAWVLFVMWIVLPLSVRVENVFMYHDNKLIAITVLAVGMAVYLIYKTGEIL